MVLVLKRLRRLGHGLKFHPTDWEKPGIEPATLGLQDIGLSPTPRGSIDEGREDPNSAKSRPSSGLKQNII